MFLKDRSIVTLCLNFLIFQDWGTSQISRFLNEKTDLPVSKFFILVRSMPLQFQKDYWYELEEIEVGQLNRNWKALISDASLEDIEEILRALSNRYSELKNSKSSSQSEEEVMALSA